jgi:AcrR family transcriptional regulator
MAGGRKARERAQREALILEVARSLLLDRGYLGLTMDRIAAATEYSKGTIYQHFSCKEDVVIALAIETAQVRAKLFERASTFQGRTRERMLALGVAAELFVRTYPHHFKSENIVRTQSLRDKTSPERRESLRRCETVCMGVATGIVRDAMAQGDLVLPPEMSPEDLTFGLWSMSFGTFMEVTVELCAFTELGVDDPLATLRRNQNVFLDGFGWKPLTHEHDYTAAAVRVLNEVFPEHVPGQEALTP